VVNITPDSFSDGGFFLDPAAAIAHGLALLEEGADLLDLGSESTRPGSGAGPAARAESALSADEEQARLLPVLEGIVKQRPDAIVSVDTYKAATSQAALEAGAAIIKRIQVGCRYGRGVRARRLRRGADAYTRNSGGVGRAVEADAG